MLQRPLVVLYLGNLIDSKGYAVVMEAARLAEARSLNFKFVIAGAKTNMGSIDADGFIRQHGLRNLAYLGAVEGGKKHDLLAGADVLALPTRYPVEGQPIVILEAMHYGLAVLTTRVGCIPDVVADGRNGLFIEPDDPEGLLRMIELLSADPALRSRISRENMRVARERYTSASHADALLRVLCEAAEGVPGPSLC